MASNRQRNKLSRRIFGRLMALKTNQMSIESDPLAGRHNETHGDREAQQFMDELSGDPLAMSVSALVTEVESEGWEHVCTIYTTPGRLNNGMGLHLDAGDADAIEAARIAAQEGMREYHRGQMEMCQRRLDTNDFQPDGPGNWTKEACERTLESHLLSIERAGNGHMWPAYESVAIFLSEKPTPEQVEFMKARAILWSQAPREVVGYKQPDVTIKGFRLIEQQVQTTSTEIAI